MEFENMLQRRKYRLSAKGKLKSWAPDAGHRRVSQDLSPFGDNGTHTFTDLRIHFAGRVLYPGNRVISLVHRLGEIGWKKVIIGRSAFP